MHLGKAENHVGNQSSFAELILKYGIFAKTALSVSVPYGTEANLLPNGGPLLRPHYQGSHRDTVA